MKINKLLILLLLFFVGATATFAKGIDALVVKGTYKSKYDKEISLYCAKEGAWIKVATTTLDPNGNYTFAVDSPEYKLWAIGYTKFTATKNKAEFCGKNGDYVTINSPEKLEEYTFTGTVSSYNKSLEELNTEMQKVLPDFCVTNTYKVLYPKIDDFLKNINEIASRVKGGDKQFNEFLKLYIRTKADFRILDFRMQPCSIHPTEEEIIPFYRTINEKMKFNSPLYADMPFTNLYISLLSTNYMITYGDKYKVDGGASYLKSLVTDDKVKVGEFIDKVRRKYSDYNDFEKDYNEVKDFLYTDEQRNLVKTYIGDNKNMASGQPGTDFTYPDINGKNVSFSDFKGKVVVIDVWATWCAPCKSEIPHLKKLEEEFKSNPDIVFLGVSVDKEADKEKWKKMVQDEKLAGVHLFANGFSEISQIYKINGIPRFMVFDKQGNIVSTNAPRPSKPELKQMILNTLKK